MTTRELAEQVYRATNLSSAEMKYNHRGQIDYDACRQARIAKIEAILEPILKENHDMKASVAMSGWRTSNSGNLFAMYATANKKTIHVPSSTGKSEQIVEDLEKAERMRALSDCMVAEYFRQHREHEERMRAEMVEEVVRAFFHVFEKMEEGRFT